LCASKVTQTFTKTLVFIAIRVFVKFEICFFARHYIAIKKALKKIKILYSGTFDIMRMKLVRSKVKLERTLQNFLQKID
jgi:hypothetical protein